MAEKTTQNYQALIRRIKKKKQTYLFFTEGQTGHGRDTKRPCSETGFRDTPLLPALCKQPFCMLGLSKHSIVHGTMTGSAPSQCTTLRLEQPCSKVFFLNTVHESFKILSSTSSVPLSLGLFHLATGSTSLMVQPCGPDLPSFTSGTGRTRGVKRRVLRHRHNWSEGEWGRGTEAARKRHQWEERRKKGERGRTGYQR